LHLIKCDFYNPSYGISKNPDTNHYIMVFQRSLYCKKCGKKYNDELKSEYDDEWCKECEINNLKLNFGNWTSGNDEIDNFIQKMQLKIDLTEDIIIEWIPFNQFIDVKLIVEEDDFTKIYSAVWKNDLLYYDLLYYNSPYYNNKHVNVKRLKLKFTLKYSPKITKEVIIYKFKFKYLLEF
jgi:hypothetical protein